MPKEDSDQPAYLYSLIRIFTVHILDSKGCKVFFMQTMKTLIRLHECDGDFLLGAHVRRYIFSHVSSLVFVIVLCMYILYFLSSQQ